MVKNLMATIYIARTARVFERVLSAAEGCYVKSQYQ